MYDDTPIRDPALCIELGADAVQALMTRADWERQVDRFLYEPDPVGGGATGDHHD